MACNLHAKKVLRRQGHVPPRTPACKPIGRHPPAAQRSTDGGKNWVSANAAPKSPLYAVAVPPGSTTTAWALGGPCESRQPWDDGCTVCPACCRAAGRWAVSTVQSAPKPSGLHHMPAITVSHQASLACPARADWTGTKIVSVSARVGRQCSLPLAPCTRAMPSWAPACGTDAYLWPPASPVRRVPGAADVQDNRFWRNVDAANRRLLASQPTQSAGHFNAGCERLLRCRLSWHVRRG